MQLFDSNGYLDIEGIRRYQEEKGLVFCFIWGGRGIGKTYGALMECVRRNRDTGEKFIMLRRTKTQVDLITNERFMPFKTLNHDKGWGYFPFAIGSSMYGFFDSEIDENGKRVKIGEEIGLALPVSTSGNIRGYDGYDISFALYDEFIPMKSERPIKGEAELLFNTLETIGRNRELKNEKPLYFMGLSNSNNVDNPYFLELGIVNRALKMSLQKDNAVFEDRRRGLLLICINNSPISDKKKQTSLYNLTGQDSEYARMALDNDFVEVERKSIRSMDLRHYDPLVYIGGICIYKSKSETGRFYVSEHVKGNPQRFGTSEIEAERFRRKYYYLFTAYMNDRIRFETHLTEYLFQVYNKI